LLTHHLLGLKIKDSTRAGTVCIALLAHVICISPSDSSQINAKTANRQHDTSASATDSLNVSIADHLVHYGTIAATRKSTPHPSLFLPRVTFRSFRNDWIDPSAVSERESCETGDIKDGGQGSAMTGVAEMG
jgi:hypothetical protein